MIAATSASICPWLKKSITCKWASDAARVKLRSAAAAITASRQLPTPAVDCGSKFVGTVRNRLPVAAVVSGRYNRRVAIPTG
jgi:hypothetical protein